MTRPRQLSHALEQANLRLMTGVGLFLFTLLTRIPFRTQYLYHWDSVDYALALQRFSLRDFQPHPPGYFFYVALGGLVNRVVADANSAYIWISLIASALAVLLLYLFISELYNYRIAFWSSVFLATSPLFWFYGEVALPYTLDLAIVILIAWVCYRALQGQSSALWLSALMLGLAGGIRPQTTIFLFPLWLFATHHQAVWKIASGILLIGLAALAWFLPLASTIGGVIPYINFIRAYSASLSNLSPLRSIRSFVVNVGRLAIFLFYAIPLGLPIFAFGAVVWIEQQLSLRGSVAMHAMHSSHIAMRQKQSPCGGSTKEENASKIPSPSLKSRLSDRDWFLLLWILPPLLFLLLFHLEQPGHVLVLLPPCAIILSRIISAQDSALARATGAAIILANLVFFLFVPARLVPRPEAVFKTTSLTSLRQRDNYLRDAIRYISTQFDPKSTAILGVSNEYHHPDYYLQDFMRVKQPGLTSAKVILLPMPIRTLILFGDFTDSRLQPPRHLTPVRVSDQTVLYILTAGDGQQILVDASGYGIVQN